MKKLAILFLLTAVIVSFTFAQVSVKADFSVGNINKGNSAAALWGGSGPYVAGTTGQIGYADPVLRFVTKGAGSQEIGPGTLGFEVQLGVKNSFYDSDYVKQGGGTFIGAGGVAPTDETYAGASYVLGVGPGKLGFAVNYKFDPAGPGVYGYTGTRAYLWTLEPGVSYTGIGLGPVVLGVGLKYDYKFNGISTDNTDGRDKGAAFFHPYGDSMSVDQIVFWFDVDTSLGLYVYYEFDYGWGKDATGRATFAKTNGGTDSEKQGQREITKIVYLDVQYKLGGLAKIGFELDDTGSGFRGSYVQVGGKQQNEFNTETTGFTLKPKADFSLGSLGFGAYIKFKNLMPTNVDQEVQVTPGAYVKYTL